MRYLSLAGFLFAFWLALSGHYTPMLVAAGAASAVLCLLAAIRMRVVDAEGHPVHLFRRVVTYFPWLIREIVKSGWGVTKLILHPRLPISPTMTVVRASQRTRAAVATYANSITLTPGTITVGCRTERRPTEEQRRRIRSCAEEIGPKLRGADRRQATLEALAQQAARVSLAAPVTPALASFSMKSKRS